MNISNFTHYGITYEFEPPMKVPDGQSIRTLGELVAWDTYSFDYAEAFSENAIGELRKLTAQSIDEKILQESPNKILTTLMFAMLNKHEVRIKY